MVRRAAAKRQGGRRVMRKRVAKKRVHRTASQYATITETIEFKDLGPNTSYNLCFNLSQFVRASKLATSFKWYKAAKVEWALQPIYNVFQDTVDTDSVPYIYSLMNRTQDNLGLSLADMQGSGAKPMKLVNKLTKSYVPNWCSSGLSTYLTTPTVPGNPITQFTNQGLRAQYSFLATPDDASIGPGIAQYITPQDGRDVLPPNSGMNSINVNQVLYNGHYVWIDQLVSGGTQAVARCVATVTWRFKEPKCITFVRDVPPIEPKEVPV